MTEDTADSLLGFNYQGAIDVPTPDGIGAVKSVTFTTTIGKDCSQEELDELLDKCRLAVTRQRTFAQIEKKKIDLHNQEENLKLAQLDLVTEDKKFSARADNHDGRAERGLSASEQKTRQEKLKNIVNQSSTMNATRETLARLYRLVGEGASYEQPNGNGEQGRWSDNGGNVEVGASPEFRG